MAGARAAQTVTRLGRKPGLTLYRRLTGLDRADEQRAIGTYLVGFAEGLAERADYRPGDGLKYVAFRAASANLGVLLGVLIGRTGSARYQTGLLTRAEIDHLEEFWDFCAQVRRGIAVAQRGPLGRVREQPWLLARGHADARALDRYENNACRFLNDVRLAADKPDIFADLPAFVPEARPPWRWLAPLGALALVALALVLVAMRRPPAAPDPPLASAGVVFTVELGDEPRLIGGWHEGRWIIAAPGGAVREVPGPELWLPAPVEGGAAGDLDGDGRPELALYSSVPYDAAAPPPTGVWIYTRAGDRWRLLDVVPAHAGAPDPERCRDLLEEQERRPRSDANRDLARARQRCPQTISGIAITGGSLWMWQGHYGRQLLRVRCDARECGHPEQVLPVDSDIAGGVWLEAPDGPVLALATGCWQENGPWSYGALALGGLGRGPPRPAFLRLGGRVEIARLDARRVAMLSGLPCEKLSENELVATAAAGPWPRLRTLLIAELDGGALRPVEAARIGDCCGTHSRLVALRAAGRAAWLAAVIRVDDDAWRVATYDLGRALVAQHPRSLPVSGEGVVLAAAVDIDGDGIDELLLSRRRGASRERTEVYRIAADGSLVAAGW